jgi:hypothetical protein
VIASVWNRVDGPSRTALIVGLVLMLAAIPLPTLVAVFVGLAAAAVLGYLHPDDVTQVAVLVALPVLIIAFILGFVRGFNTTLLLVILVPSLIAPVWLARQGAGMRRGRDV